MKVVKKCLNAAFTLLRLKAEKQQERELKLREGVIKTLIFNHLVDRIFSLILRFSFTSLYLFKKWKKENNQKLNFKEISEP